MITATLTLAAADPWSIGLTIAGLILTVLLAIVAWIAARADHRSQKLETTTEALVDQKFQTARAELTTTISTAKLELLALVTSLREAQARIEQRLGQGDAMFVSLNERDHKLEVAFIQRVEQLHRDMLETFVTKDDHDALSRKLDALTSQVQTGGRRP